MKKLFYTFLLWVFLSTSNAQQSTTRLIVRGDDMGYTHSGNEALIKCYKEGIETSIEVIVASPWFPEAVKLLKQNSGVDVGIYLALTSEWISHLSSHMGCTSISNDVKALTKKLSKEYNIPVDPYMADQAMVGYDGPHKTSEEKI